MKTKTLPYLLASITLLGTSLTAVAGNELACQQSPQKQSATAPADTAQRHRLVRDMCQLNDAEPADEESEQASASAPHDSAKRVDALIFASLTASEGDDGVRFDYLQASQPMPRRAGLLLPEHGEDSQNTDWLGQPSALAPEAREHDTAPAVPEPTSYAMLLAGLALMIVLGRKARAPAPAETRARIGTLQRR
ncbi:PEP-CTERM sorting domain-containing protein [Duganella aceris]|uniref:PEP-CTERM sorting domain-containing protein n=1 Tax=Duganella aceris TaxID=2703883 RepID=A0ABX0FU76_9BURK|nr:PEP-CTERM sorting domain-containing protein [Duganella aceris]NGZ88018.1 PEP-CTERM sorting domain-containing protein [Duganella aceris]